MGGQQFSPLIIVPPARELHSRYAMQQDYASTCHSGCGVTKILYEYLCWTSCIAQVSLLTILVKLESSQRNNASCTLPEIFFLT